MMVKKRSGDSVSFDADKIYSAVSKAFDDDLQEGDPAFIANITSEVSSKVVDGNCVEDIQDLVEKELMLSGYHGVAKKYILYRDKKKSLRSRSESRDKSAFDDAARYFQTPSQMYQFYSKYARWNSAKKRRETWTESVGRVMTFLQSKVDLPESDWDRLTDSMVNMRAVPAQRILQMAGPALDRCAIGAYNCSALGVDSIEAFVEILYISMQGTGVGFSVEEEFVHRLPGIRRQKKNQVIPAHVVEDSTEGWCDAYRAGLKAWFAGTDITFDCSHVRPAGARVVTKGGTSGGPDPLIALLAFARAKILANQGGRLRPLACADVVCKSGQIVHVGSIRRSALICLFDADDEEMALAKSGTFWNDNDQRFMSNNSRVYEEKPSSKEFLGIWKELADSGTGENGIFNRESLVRQMPKRRKKTRLLTNPCFAGSTWIAVADGRGRVRLSDLVSQGKDVEVYTMIDGKLAIRPMRNFRLTGEKQQLYKIEFADGTFLRVTGNHKFPLKSGKEKTTLELKKNDALQALSVSSYKAASDRKSYSACDYDDSKAYRRVSANGESITEHRMIYQHANSEVIENGDHIHHIDFNQHNNHPSNLLRLSSKEHAALHRDRMLGDNNPARRLMTPEWCSNVSKSVTGSLNGNALEISNPDLKAALTDYIKELGYRPSIDVYQKYASENNLPQTFTEYRKEYFGGDIHSTLDSISESFGFIRPKGAKAVSCELPIHYKGATGWVTKTCEMCSGTFEIEYTRREQATCSQSCSSRLYVKLHGTTKATENLKAFWENKHVSLRESQVGVYNDLSVTLGQRPSKKQWIEECKTQNISFEISRVTSPFRLYENLEDAAGATNHRVISVTLCEIEDVYTGTVEESHTLFAIENEAISAKGNTLMSFVLSQNCGEIGLRDMGLCNLSICIARFDDTRESLEEKVTNATIFGTIQSTLTNFSPYVRKTWKANCEEERLLGVDITGQMDCPLLVPGAPGREELLDHLLEVSRAVNIEYAAKLGINPSVAITTVKPSGNSAQMYNCSSGIHPRHAPYYIRRFRAGRLDPLTQMMIDAGVPWFPETNQSRDKCSVVVFEFPIKSPDGAITKNDMSATDMLDNWLVWKKHWTEHTVSCTVSIGDDEWLQAGNWVFEHWDDVTGISFLPRDGGIYQLAPYEDCTQEEYEKRNAAFPILDFSKLSYYETMDTTEFTGELACTSATGCEI